MFTLSWLKEASHHFVSHAIVPSIQTPAFGLDGVVWFVTPASLFVVSAVLTAQIQW